MIYSIEVNGFGKAGQSTWLTANMEPEQSGFGEIHYKFEPLLLEKGQRLVYSFMIRETEDTFESETNSFVPDGALITRLFPEVKLLETDLYAIGVSMSDEHASAIADLKTHYRINKGVSYHVKELEQGGIFGAGQQAVKGLKAFHMSGFPVEMTPGDEIDVFFSYKVNEGYRYLENLHIDETLVDEEAPKQSFGRPLKPPSKGEVVVLAPKPKLVGVTTKIISFKVKELSHGKDFNATIVHFNGEYFQVQFQLLQSPSTEHIPVDLNYKINSGDHFTRVTLLFDESTQRYRSTVLQLGRDDLLLYFFSYKVTTNTTHYSNTEVLQFRQQDEEIRWLKTIASFSSHFWLSLVATFMT